MQRRTNSIHLWLCLVTTLATTGFAATNTIQVFNLDFGSAPSTHIDPVIQPGDTVAWVWASDGIPHSTTAAPGQLENWDSTLHTEPFSFSHTFQNVGTFGYYCTLHGLNAGCGNGSAMSGKVIVVLPGATPDRVTAVTREGDDIRTTWITGGLCKTNALQRATGAADGSFTNNFTDIFLITNTVDNVTNYLDVGAATNFPAVYYRVRLVQ
jgi:plastocyanin